MTPDDLIAFQAQLKEEEGLRLKPYQDTVGKLSIGYGRNLTDKGISADEAEYLLVHDIQATMAAVSVRLPWFPRLDGVRQRVLLDMAYNQGLGGLLLFQDMLAAVERGDYETAAAEMLNSKWAEQVGSRATKLAEWMRSGEAKV